MNKRGRKKISRLQLQLIINWIMRPYATLGRVDLFKFRAAYWCTHWIRNLPIPSLSTVWCTNFAKIWPHPNSHKLLQILERFKKYLSDPCYCSKFFKCGKHAWKTKSSYQAVLKTLPLFYHIMIKYVCVWSYKTIFRRQDIMSELTAIKYTTAFSLNKHVS